MRDRQAHRNAYASASLSAYQWPRRSLESRFWPKVHKTEGCWLWTASLDHRGYGQINAGGRRGKPLAAHRVAYELVVGPIPDGTELDHLCRNTICVRPDHLDPVTHTENMYRTPWVQAQMAKTRCVHGHEFTPANTYRRPGDNRRQCRACRRERQQKAA